MHGTYDVENDVVCLDNCLDLIMFGMGRDDGLHAELRFQNACLFWVAHEGSDLESVGVGVIEETV